MNHAGRVKLLSQGITIDNLRVATEDTNPFILQGQTSETPSTRLTLSAMALSISDEAVTRALEQHGIKLRSKISLEYERLKDRSLSSWKNGKRFLWIELPETPPPRYIDIGPAKVELWYREFRQQTMKCFNCQQLGHMAHQCENETVCHVCNVPGHRKGDPQCRHGRRGGGLGQHADEDEVSEEEKSDVEDDEEDGAKDDEDGESDDEDEGGEDEGDESNNQGCKSDDSEDEGEEAEDMDDQTEGNQSLVLPSENISVQSGGKYIIDGDDPVADAALTDGEDARDRTFSKSTPVNSEGNKKMSRLYSKAHLVEGWGMYPTDTEDEESFTKVVSKKNRRMQRKPKKEVRSGKKSEESKKALVQTDIKKYGKRTVGQAEISFEANPKTNKLAIIK